MKGYLLDTNAVSLLYDGRASEAFEDWLRQRFGEKSLYLSTITVLEIQKGATKLELVKNGNPTRARQLHLWLQRLIEQYADSILVVDTETALAAGTLDGAMRSRGHNGQLADILIAATAQTHGLTVVTANTRDFEPLGVDCLAPF
ncbi:type II toxin-antitoxin system VapC family toxin [Rhizobium glycinendophyticum]|uniref:Ribonuclease VapC n=1 Tax=Rhizobium glycinendophyticum TaxID=2589807 RepID=A0A504TV80_9HYPH|nr:type II toxin-antitoxin system VapC family toxin [Rhizobium glycinendophyticum]TPP06658.1 type II toxin-antitoxin system VapC family toxin [Rhizobium glycinendophyticum]